ncbi:MAG: hypothetical protein FJ318_06185 [SAR202 cluster bacterium]|nr:hypothetical protein [SAR202 cluster bacterium]
MATVITTTASPDGELIQEERDAQTNELLLRVALPAAEQPLKVRLEHAILERFADWDRWERSRAFHVAQGQSYYDAVAGAAGLPTGAAAYNTAATAVTNRRDVAWGRYLVALGEWRTA